MSDRRKMPPIEGVPTDVPVCAYCGTKFKPFSEDTRDKGFVVVRREFKQWNAYNGLFCRLRCARFFAVAAYRAGYRIQK